MLRRREFSGYQPVAGTSYVMNTSLKAVNQGIDKGVDGLENVAIEAGKVPVIGKASSKWRNRILSYTRPFKKLRNDNIKKQRVL